MSQPAKTTSFADWARAAIARDGHTPAAHHVRLNEELDRLAAGEIRRLMVLMPPGSAKSTYTSVLFPVWWFARHSGSSVIAISHTATLATRFGRTARTRVGTHGAELCYELTPGHRAATDWGTSTGGEYYATGVRGPITGRRADLVIIDDPIKGFGEVDRSAQRERLWDWYRGELSTRLKPGGRVALVMTRWHPDDLAGRLLASGEEWTVLCMPALDADGRALWPEYESEAALLRRRDMSGPRVWSALYQQQPIAPGGTMFDDKHVAVIRNVPFISDPVRAWDLAATEACDGRDPDWTVGLKLAKAVTGCYVVLDVVRFRGNPGEVLQTIVETARADGRDVTIALPQDPGQAGKTQVAFLGRRLAGYRIESSPETGSKTLRANPVASQVHLGNLAVLEAPWTRAFLDELREFPNGAKDDQIDALSRAFNLVADLEEPARKVDVQLFGR